MFRLGAATAILTNPIWAIWSDVHHASKLFPCSPHALSFLLSLLRSSVGFYYRIISRRRLAQTLPRDLPRPIRLQQWQYREEGKARHTSISGGALRSSDVHGRLYMRSWSVPGVYGHVWHVVRDVPITSHPLAHTGIVPSLRRTRSPC